jgi:DNA-directed RNA polymerase specialized sigma24 family protein
MGEKNSDMAEVAEAVRDLTRVILALDEQSSNKSEVIRRLHAHSILPARIASLLGMKSKDVTSALSKAKKQIRNGDNSERATIQEVTIDE